MTSYDMLNCRQKVQKCNSMSISFREEVNFNINSKMEEVENKHNVFLPPKIRCGTRKMNSDESMWCNQGSPREMERNSDLADSRKMSLARKGRLWEKLPSPRELLSPLLEKNPDCGKKQLISISELNPFFEELDLSSSASLSDDEDNPNMIKENDCVLGNNDECHDGRKESSLIKWSSLESSTLPGLPIAAKSDESFSSSGPESRKGNRSTSKSNSQGSSSEGAWNAEGKARGGLTSRLKKVTNRVRKQLSVTGDFLTEKFTRSSTKSQSSIEIDYGGCGDVCQDQNPSSEESFKENVPSSPILHDSHVKEHSKVFRSPTTVYKETDTTTCVTTQNAFNDNEMVESGGLILNIPNWVDNPVTFEKCNTSLEEIVEDEKQRLAQKSPIIWAEAVEYLGRSVDRDFRRGYLALGEKMRLPNLQAVRCIKFNSCHSYLAIGCEEGYLILLGLDYQKPLYHTRPDQSFQNLLCHIPLGSKCRIQMNETLVGHAFDLRCMAWNGTNGKLVTADEIGVMIGWGYGPNGCWVEELINDRSTSMIRDIVFSQDGTKIAIGYEDHAESGFVTGGILVGLSDGTQIYNRQFPDAQVNSVAWHTENTVLAVVNCTLFLFDEQGEVGKTCRPLTINGQSTEITSFLLKPKSSWVTYESTPEFAVIYKESCMSLYNTVEDKAPLRIHTQLTAKCADWSPNGLYIVVGGMTTITRDGYLCPQINLYNYEGNLLQVLKIPEQTITSISWDHDSLHLAVAAERQIYFASLRPMYKVSSSRNNVHCYAYTKDFVSHLISFWNHTTLFKENIPGKVIDIKCHKDKFGVLCMDKMGVYQVFVFGETGVYLQHLCILTMEPFALTMTKTSIVCLAPNGILNWNFNLNNDGNNNLTGTIKKKRQVHVDDFPGIIAKPGEKDDHIMKNTMDCARCMHGTRDRLCVARESGKLQLYALPTLGFLQTYHMDLEGDICQEIRFNNDGSQLALLSMNGDLRVCIFPQVGGQQLEVILCENLTSVSGILWAYDLETYICVLECNNLHILKDGHILETISNIPSGCYLANYEDLHVTLINMDRVVENPENPSNGMVIRLPIPTLSKLKDALDHDEPLEDIVNLLSTSCSHTVLRKLVADEALRQGEYQLAESIYNDDKNYAAVEFMKRLGEIESLDLKKAQAYCFLSEYNQAQHYFLRSGRKDLAIKMWKDLGDWEKVNFLSGYTSEESLEVQCEAYIDSQDWEMALELCNKLGNAEKLIECCVMLEDYEKLAVISKKLPLKSPLLCKVVQALASVGMMDEAVATQTQIEFY